MKPKRLSKKLDLSSKNVIYSYRGAYYEEKPALARLKYYTYDENEDTYFGECKRWTFGVEAFTVGILIVAIILTFRMGIPSQEIIKLDTDLVLYDDYLVLNYLNDPSNRFPVILTIIRSDGVILTTNRVEVGGSIGTTRVPAHGLDDGVYTITIKYRILTYGRNTDINFDGTLTVMNDIIPEEYLY